MALLLKTPYGAPPPLIIIIVVGIGIAITFITTIITNNNSTPLMTTLLKSPYDAPPPLMPLDYRAD